MRKGISQLDLQTAFSGLSREVAAGRIGRKSASTLAYLGLVLFQSDQMITEDEFRAAAGSRWSHIRALLDDAATAPTTIAALSMLLPPPKLLATPLTDLDPMPTSSKSNHSATYTINFVIFFPFSYFRIRCGHTLPVIVNHPPLPNPLDPPLTPPHCALLLLVPQCIHGA